MDEYAEFDEVFGVLVLGSTGDREPGSTCGELGCITAYDSGICGPGSTGELVRRSTGLVEGEL